MRKRNFQTFLGDLKESLTQLPQSHQLAFAALCCERAYPNYRTFSEQERWGNPAVLRAALDAAWNFIRDDGSSKANWSDLLSQCKASTPDTDRFHAKTASESAVISAGQEAALMVMLLLEFCKDPDPNYGVRIATLARDTIDMEVQILEKLEPSDPELEAKIDQHPFMLRELQRQEDDLSLLTKTTTPTGLRPVTQP